jgi:hypothetical protein
MNRISNKSLGAELGENKKLEGLNSMPTQHVPFGFKTLILFRGLPAKPVQAGCSGGNTDWF